MVTDVTNNEDPGYKKYSTKKISLNVILIKTFSLELRILSAVKHCTVYKCKPSRILPKSCKKDRSKTQEHDNGYYIITNKRC